MARTSQHAEQPSAGLHCSHLWLLLLLATWPVATSGWAPAGRMWGSSPEDTYSLSLSLPKWAAVDFWQQHRRNTSAEKILPMLGVTSSVHMWQCQLSGSPALRHHHESVRFLHVQAALRGDRSGVRLSTAPR